MNKFIYYAIQNIINFYSINLAFLCLYKRHISNQTLGDHRKVYIVVIKFAKINLIYGRIRGYNLFRITQTQSHDLRKVVLFFSYLTFF
jgi:hypothetical protein